MTKQEYTDYLQTPHWQAVKAWVRMRSHGICERCHDKKAEHTHHSHYLTLGAELPGDVIHLCAPCHLAVHPEVAAKIAPMPQPMRAHGPLAESPTAKRGSARLSKRARAWRSLSPQERKGMRHLWDVLEVEGRRWTIIETTDLKAASAVLVALLKGGGVKGADGMPSRLRHKGFLQYRPTLRDKRSAFAVAVDRRLQPVIMPDGTGHWLTDDRWEVYL
jgi:hypothetical protein